MDRDEIQPVQHGLILGIVPVAPMAYFVIDAYLDDYSSFFDGFMNFWFIVVLGVLLGIAASAIAYFFVLLTQGRVSFGNGSGFVEERRSNEFDGYDFQWVTRSYEVSPEDAAWRSALIFVKTIGYGVFFGFLFAGIAFSIVQIV